MAHCYLNNSLYHIVDMKIVDRERVHFTVFLIKNYCWTMLARQNRSKLDDYYSIILLS